MKKEREGRKEREGKKEESCIGELAQLARALALQARGQGFDSLILHERRVKKEYPEKKFIDMMEGDTRRA